MSKIPKNPNKKDWKELCKKLNDGKIGMDLCVPIQKAEEFFNQLLKEFPGAKLTVTLNMPVQDVIQIPRGLEADDNSLADLNEETLTFSPIPISGGPKKEAARIKNILNKKIFSKSGFIFEIKTSLGIIILEKYQERNYIAFFCENPNESITDDESRMNIPCELLTQIMPILEPYITSYKNFEL